MRPAAAMYTCLCCGEPLRRGTTQEPSREVARCEPCQAAGRWWTTTPALEPELASLVMEAPYYHQPPWVEVEPGIFERTDVAIDGWPDAMEVA